MQSITKMTAAIGTLVLLGTPVAAQAGGNGGSGGGGGNGAIISYINSLPIEYVDANEVADLQYSRQEEKLARDVYRVLYQAWGTPVFDNIAAAEQSHMDLTLFLLNRYGIADPLTSDVTGVFPDPSITMLYRRLTGFGLQSPLHALVVGAIVEDMDLYDLDHAIARTDNRDLGTLWQNLSRGSRNHMRAFYGQLENQGIIFRGIRLTYARILQIVLSPQENEPVDENGVVLP